MGIYNNLNFQSIHTKRMADRYVINRIYLYDDKLVVAFKDGMGIITLGNVETALNEVGVSPDFVCFAISDINSHICLMYTLFTLKGRSGIY